MKRLTRNQFTLKQDRFGIQAHYTSFLSLTKTFHLTLDVSNF